MIWRCGDCGYTPLGSSRPAGACHRCRGDFTWRLVKCDRCVAGDCHLCDQFDGPLVVLEDEVEDCCCFHLFDHLPWADGAPTAVSPPPVPVDGNGQ